MSRAVCIHCWETESKLTSRRQCPTQSLSSEPSLINSPRPHAITPRTATGWGRTTQFITSTRHWKLPPILQKIWPTLWRGLAADLVLSYVSQVQVWNPIFPDTQIQVWQNILVIRSSAFRINHFFLLDFNTRSLPRIFLWTNLDYDSSN